jgi:hypothetical protein
MCRMMREMVEGHEENEESKRGDTWLTRSGEILKGKE